MNTALLSASVFLLVVAGCTAPDVCPEEPEPPAFSTYDLSCAVDADCGLAAIPNCGPCSCDDTPIRLEDAARFVEEQTRCCEESEIFRGTCGACLVVVARCSGGLCIAEVEEE